jgi:hypothetical protein
VLVFILSPPTNMDLYGMHIDRYLKKCSQERFKLMIVLSVFFVEPMQLNAFAQNPIFLIANDK